MNYQDRIIELLDIYLERNKTLKRKHTENITNKALYEELIPLISSDYETIMDNRIMISILLNTIYKNNIYSQFYSALLNKNMNQNDVEFKEFLSMIISDYNKLLSDINNQLNRIERSKNLVSAANKVKLAIKQSLPIRDSKYDVMYIKRILSYFEIEGEISNKEELLLINEIELYNRKLLSKNGNDCERLLTEEIYQQIPNILSAGFEIYPEIKVSDERRKSLDDFVKQILGFIDNLEDEKVVEAIKNYRRYDITEDEYKYIVTEILNKYANEMIDYYNFIIDKDLYTSRENREEIINEYYKCLNKFLIIREHYNEITEEIIVSGEEPTDIEEISHKKTLLYSSTMVSGLKPRIISDMKDIPYEYYETVLDLINRFKMGQIQKKEIKSFPNNKIYIGMMELKSDMIRVIIRHIKDNIFSISGVFAKKSDNNIPVYHSMAKRDVPDIGTDDKYQNELLIAEYTETELEKLVKAKARKGTR